MKLENLIVNFYYIQRIIVVSSRYYYTYECYDTYRKFDHYVSKQSNMEALIYHRIFFIKYSDKEKYILKFFKQNKNKFYNLNTNKK